MSIGLLYKDQWKKKKLKNWLNDTGKLDAGLMSHFRFSLV